MGCTAKGLLRVAVICGLLTLGSSEVLHGKDDPNLGIQVAPIFSDHMVLQRDVSAPVWGTAKPGERVSVRFNDQEKTAVADVHGKWMVHLEPLTASAKPETLTVTGPAGQCVFNHVLVGEVWLCSGQSNMECGFSNLQIVDEIKEVDYPQIRLNSGEKWSPCTTDNLLEFSSVGYYFGLNLWKQLQVPIGLINISRGCSSIEAWMTPGSLEANDSLVDQNGWNLFAEMQTFQQFCGNYAQSTAAEKESMFLRHCRSNYVFAHQFLGEDGKPRIGQYEYILRHMQYVKPAYLYNTRIAPIVPFGMKGAIWYQGETNVGDSLYARKQQILVESWRKLWGEGEFPFYFVQVAPFNGYPKLTDFWLQQYEAARRVPQSGMVSIVDISDLNECHPKNKRDVGLRLAMLALRDSYGKHDLVASGPTYKSIQVEGAKVLVTFDHAETGLTTKDGQAPNWFEVAGSDGKFVKAEATIEGNAVAIHSPIEHPAFVRYAWDYRTNPNLCNQSGLPAFPFNTSDAFFQQNKQ